MIAMCLGGDVANKADDALGVEMRIEGGQLPDCPGNLVDEARDRPFLFPDIAQKTRQDPGLGGKFATQRLAREDCVEEREPVCRPHRQRHRQQARERTSPFSVGFAPGEPECRALGERRAKLGNETGPGRRMESVEIGRLPFQPFRTRVEASPVRCGEVKVAILAAMFSAPGGKFDMARKIAMRVLTPAKVGSAGRPK